MSIYKKLISIQTELKAPKNQFNKFGNYSYRSCEDILEGLKPILLKNKCTQFISDSVVVIGDRYYIQATVTLVCTETGESVEASALAREEQQLKGMIAAQITGSCSSYARKYALNGLYAIDDTKDADSFNKHEKSTNKVESSGKQNNKSTNMNNRPSNSNAEFFCSSCNSVINQKVYDYSRNKYNKALCFNCQNKQ